jgi:phosphonate transport system permease protein
VNTRSALLGDGSAALLARHRALLAKPWTQRAAEIGGSFASLGMVLFSICWLGISFGQIGPGFAALFKFISLMFPPSTGGHLPLYLRAMAETLSIAVLGTLTAAALALPLALLAAQNTSPNGILRFLVRRLLDVIRGVDTLIWALVFVGVVGLGPFAGILAIAVSDTGALGKLFSEAIEVTRFRVRCSISSSRTRVRPRSSALSAPVGSDYSFPNRSVRTISTRWRLSFC